MMAPPCRTTVTAQEVVIVNIAGGGPAVTEMGKLDGASIDVFAVISHPMLPLESIVRIFLNLSMIFVFFFFKTKLF